MSIHKEVDGGSLIRFSLMRWRLILVISMYPSRAGTTAKRLSASASLSTSTSTLTIECGDTSSTCLPTALVLPPQHSQNLGHYYICDTEIWVDAQ